VLSREDDLTGLLNRRGFLEVLRSRLVDPDRASALVAVLDVDGFKLVNDGFGHAAGDMVLVSTAARLCAALPPGTAVARIGGDEFAFLVEAADDDKAAEVVEQAVLRCSDPVSVVGLSVPLTLSVGTAVPAAAGADEVLLQADLAMYRAKRRGSIVAAYDPGLDDPATRRLRDVLALRRVITSGELVVLYQPVVPVGAGPLRLEALVRQRVDGRLLPPNGWLQTAVRAGLMTELTDSVVGKVVDQLALWWADGLEVEVAVNVPAPVLALPEGLNGLLSRLAAAGLPRRALSVEVTEGDLVGPQAKAALTRCADADISVAVDDFGTGWSALSYLVDLPLRTLKIDRTFVEGCDVDPRRAAVVRAVIEVAHQLGLWVVAEGVETTGVADVLIELGADALQGYLYSRPQSADDLAGLLRSGLVATHS
jgi:diguanylate cyclase (GGDEF)-like protein